MQVAFQTAAASSTPRLGPNKRPGQIILLAFDPWSTQLAQPFSPGVQVLVRGNIKVAFEYQHTWEQPVPDSAQFFRLNGFAAGVDYVF